MKVCKICRVFVFLVTFSIWSSTAKASSSSSGDELTSLMGARPTTPVYLKARSALVATKLISRFVVFYFEHASLPYIQAAKKSHLLNHTDKTRVNVVGTFTIINCLTNAAGAYADCSLCLLKESTQFKRIALLYELTTISTVLLAQYLPLHLLSPNQTLDPEQIDSRNDLSEFNYYISESITLLQHALIARALGFVVTYLQTRFFSLQHIQTAT